MYKLHELGPAFALLFQLIGTREAVEARIEGVKGDKDENEASERQNCCFCTLRTCSQNFSINSTRELTFLKIFNIISG